MNGAHPSFFALDALAAGHGEGSEIRVHLQTCARCQAHLARVKTQADSLPAWLREDPRLTSPQGRAAFSQPRGLFFWKNAWAWALPLAIVGAALLFVQLEASRPQPAYTGVKAATPTVWAYVKRGGSTFSWDGTAPLAEGDKLRLKVDPLDYGYISVFSRSHTGQWEKLWSGAAGGPGGRTLPAAWQVDGRPGSEHLLVIVSSLPPEAKDLEGLRGKQQHADLWLQELIFQKSGIR